MTDKRRKPKTGLSGRELLERWIVSHRMTQAEAADAIGLPRPKLNQYLHGTVQPSLESALLIEDATGIGARTWLRTSHTGDTLATPAVSEFKWR
jgi:transcriptional regulator with XRE-family HTH domain